jgi:ketosteroid isomerase-like protein
MDAAGAQRTIEVPIDSLPPVDEHSTDVRAGVDRAWEALVTTLPRVFDTAFSRRMAALLGCVYRRARGDPSVIGSTLPGFVVARSVRPSTLALLGSHRFSSYALVFRLDELGPGRSRLSGETRAEFPGATGRTYRGMVIGTGGHVRAVKRILAAVARRADATTATLDRAQLSEWLARYERAWRSAGTAALRETFADDAYYSTGPYEQPHLGIDAIARMWEAERRGPDEVFQMRSEIIAVEGDTGVVRVDVAYGEPERQQYRDLWIVRLDGEGRCVHFEEWPFWPPGSGGAPAGGADALD